MVTYGEFIDAMRETRVVGARGDIKEWAAKSIEKGFGQYSMPLTRELVLSFAEDMRTLFRDMIVHTDTEALYEMLVEDGHTFLREIHAKATKFSIDVALEEVDLPLTTAEILIASGYASVASA